MKGRGGRKEGGEESRGEGRRGERKKGVGRSWDERAGSIGKGTEGMV